MTRPFDVRKLPFGVSYYLIDGALPMIFPEKSLPGQVTKSFSAKRGRATVQLCISPSTARALFTNFPFRKKSQNRLLCCRKKRVVTTRHAARGNRKIEIAADHRSVTRVKHFSFSLRFSPRSETARKPFFSTVMHENCGAANCLPLNCFAHFSVDFVTGFFGSDSRQLRNPRRSS